MFPACPDDPAFGDTVTVDFTKGANTVFSAAAGTDITFDATKGAAFTISKDTDAPTVVSNDYIFFGKVDVVVQAAPGTGIVTSFVLQSDDLDEIDWEWLGGDTTEVQTNYFGKGNTTLYNRGGYSPVANPQTTFHTYTIDWTKDYVKWSIDGALVRTLLYADAVDGTQFPQTPCQIKLGTWDAGAQGEPTGTVEWAGGYTNFDDAPFVAYYKSITIQDYSTGATKYHWTDMSGTYESIEAVGGTSGASSSGSSSVGTSTASGATSESTAIASASTATTASGFSTTATVPITQATTGSNDTSSESSSSSSSGSSSPSSSSGTSSSSSTSSSAPSSSSSAVTSGAGAMAWSTTAVITAAAFFAFLL